MDKAHKDKAIPIIKKEMENPFDDIELSVPYKVDYDEGKNYHEAK